MHARGKACAALLAALCLAVVSGRAAAQEIAGRNSRAVCVGINGYFGLGELKYSGNDAVAIKNVLEASGDFGRLYLMTEKDERGGNQPIQNLPTQTNILRTLRQAADGAGAEDQLLFFFSGHGVERDGESYIIPIDGDEKTGIAIDEIKDIMGASRAGSKLLLIDACRSGGGMKGVPGIRGSVVENVEIGMIVSCAGDQLSYEDDRAQRSVFTLALEEGLSGSADADADRLLTGGEVYAFLSRRMDEYCAATNRVTTQTPQINDFGRKSVVMRIPDDMADRAAAPAKLLEEGRELFAKEDAGEWEKAFALFASVAASDKANAAEQAEALYYIGKSHLEGRGAERNVYTALDNLEHAANAGSADAQYSLGAFYMDGKGGERNYAKAKEWLRMAEQQRHAPAMVALGELLYTGKGGERSANDAARLFNRAATGKYPAAYRFLGVLHYDGAPGAKQSFPEAKRFFTRAVDEGDADANYWLGVMSFNGDGGERDIAEAKTFFSKAAENGYAPAQSRLGAMFLEGSGGEQDYAKAAGWLEKAADQGEGEAQFLLARLYENGLGVDASPQRAKQLRDNAVAYLRDHAELGEARAQALLGCAYSDGEGVMQDFAEAKKWLDMAAQQGSPLGQFALGNLYHAGRGVDQNYGTAISRYKEAALNGSVDAQVVLGGMHYSGQGVEKDAAETVKWYQMAADNGSDIGRRILAAMYYSGDGVGQDIPKAMQLLQSK